MEAIQLSNESFSYSWLINTTPPFFDSFDDGASFIEMDPDSTSMRWIPTGRSSHDFDFSLPGSQSPVLVHADQIFSNGHLLPLHLTSTVPNTEAVSSDSLNSVLSRSLSVDSSKRLLSRSSRHQPRLFHTSPITPMSVSPSTTFHSAHSTPASSRGGPKLKLPLLGHCAKSPKRILRKYLSFLMPLYKKVKGMRMASSKRVRSCGDSVCASPRMSVDAFPSIFFDVGVESSIKDAVLHCKKSIGQS